MNAVFPTIPNLKYSVSVTTRPPRKGEVEGVDYFFRTEEEFDELIRQDKLLEFASFVGYRYGTPKDFVLNQIAEGNVVIMDIDIQGASQIREKMPEAVLVFLVPPSWEELQKRLTHRGSDDHDVIAKRLQQAVEELKHIVHYDYFIINDELNRAAEQLRHIIMSEAARVSRIDLTELQSLWKGWGKP